VDPWVGGSRPDDFFGCGECVCGVLVCICVVGFMTMWSGRTSEVLLNSRRYHIFFSMWCPMPSGRTLRKRSFVFFCLVFRGSCESLLVSSSVWESVLFISGSWSAVHSASMVYILNFVHLWWTFHSKFRVKLS